VKDGDIISLVVVPEMRADGSFHVGYVCIYVCIYVYTYIHIYI
jgi:hypothetical protein